jgi:hypothetical protein
MRRGHILKVFVCLLVFCKYLFDVFGTLDVLQIVMNLMLHVQYVNISIVMLLQSGEVCVFGANKQNVSMLKL